MLTWNRGVLLCTLAGAHLEQRSSTVLTWNRGAHWGPFGTEGFYCAHLE